MEIEDVELAQNDYLTSCAACMEEYEIEGLRRPRQLPCGHHVCGKCFEHEKYVLCHICRGNLPDKAIINRGMVELLMLLRVKHEPEILKHEDIVAKIEELKVESSKVLDGLTADLISEYADKKKQLEITLEEQEQRNKKYMHRELQTEFVIKLAKAINEEKVNIRREIERSFQSERSRLDVMFSEYREEKSKSDKEHSRRVDDLETRSEHVDRAWRNINDTLKYAKEQAEIRAKREAEKRLEDDRHKVAEDKVNFDDYVESVTIERSRELEESIQAMSRFKNKTEMEVESKWDNKARMLKEEEVRLNEEAARLMQEKDTFEIYKRDTIKEASISAEKMIHDARVDLPRSHHKSFPYDGYPYNSMPYDNNQFVRGATPNRKFTARNAKHSNK